MPSSQPDQTSATVDIDGLKIHYREQGQGEPVILLHGWPTSSFLWRDVMGPLAETNRAIALDLPGFGKSDKPLDASYSFRFYRRALDGFAAALGIDRFGLVVHDLGGPVGLYWACQDLGRVSKLACLNTIVYPELSWAVVAFGAACRLPGIRSYLTSPRGLRAAMRLGVADKKRLSAEAIKGVQEPFASGPARKALLKAGTGLSPKGLREIADTLPAFEGPVRVIYGERDRILPDIARTAERLQRDLPQAQVTSLPDCGHFLQEERPLEIGRMLGELFSAPPVA